MIFNENFTFNREILLKWIESHDICWDQWIVGYEPQLKYVKIFKFITNVNSNYAPTQKDSRRENGEREKKKQTKNEKNNLKQISRSIKEILNQ